MKARTLRGAVLVAGAVALTALPAWGLINPNFTPIHLTEQSDTILILKHKAKEVGEKVDLEALDAPKGKKPAGVTVNLAHAPKQHQEAARQALAGWGEKPMILFVGKYEKDEVALLHVRGTWLRMTAGAGGQWNLLGIDGDMQATWAGGTDMLIRCVQYILAYRNEAAVPVVPGTDWRGQPKNVGTIKGAGKGLARSISAVDLAGDGKICLYVACAEGDHLFRPTPGKEEFEDITGKVGLKAASVASAWGDFDVDGRLDLLSFDGKALTVWNRNAEGAFTANKVAGEFKIPADCPSFEIIALAENSLPSVVVSGAVPPVILKAGGKNAFVAMTLPEAKPAPADWGKPQGCLAADFNNDGLADVIVPFEKNGLFYAARKGGGFEDPKACNVNCTAGGGKAACGDFDGDGWLDVLAAGAEGVRVFQNLRDGTFEESLGVSGEIAYKGQPFASWCGVCDFNNDARVDALLTYSNQAALLYFNRGFRSFGQSPKLELGLGEIPDFAAGQQMGLFADFDGDAAQDLAILMPDGKIYVAYNDLGEDAKAIKVRLSGKSPWCGPVNVAVWADKRLLGVREVRAGDQPAFIGIPEAGKYTLKWRFPGGEEASRVVTVETRAVDVVLDKGATPASSPAAAK